MPIGFSFPLEKIANACHGKGMNKSYFLPLILSILLTACSGNDKSLESVSSDPIRWGVVEAPVQTEQDDAVNADTDVDSLNGDNIVVYDAEKTIANDAGRSNGHYSKFKTLNLDNCTIIQTAQDSENKTWLCGNMPMDVYIHDGDGRQVIRLGGNSNYFLNGQPFNNIGQTLEWRYNGNNEIVAVIARYKYQSGALDRLAVIRTPDVNGGSCYIQLVPANAQPSQNEKARQIADNIGQYNCL